MENAVWYIYLFSVLLPGLKYCTLILPSLVALGLLINVMINEGKNGSIPLFTKALMFCVPLVALSFTLPNESQAYGLLATFGVVELSQQEQVQEISRNAVDALNNYLKTFNVE